MKEKNIHCSISWPVWRSPNAGGRAATHTTICLRPSRGLRMNLRVRSVTGLSLSAMVAVVVMVCP